MDLHDRLRRELTHDVSPETRTRHLAAASAAKGLRWDAQATPQRGLRWDARAVRRRFATGIAAMGLVAVPSAAMAQDALPGDVLYPVKLAVEPIQALFDDDVVANHRAEEAATLLADDTTTGEALERALSRAEEALADSNASETARLRVAEVRARFEEKRSTQAQQKADRDAAKAQDKADRDAAKADQNRDAVTPDAPELDGQGGAADPEGQSGNGKPDDANHDDKPKDDKPKDKGPDDAKGKSGASNGGSGKG